MKLDEFFVTGEPIIYVTEAGIALAMIGIIFYLTYFKKWKWLWTNWLTTVDHKKIGVMYVPSCGINAIPRRCRCLNDEGTAYRTEFKIT